MNYSIVIVLLNLVSGCKTDVGDPQETHLDEGTDDPEGREAQILKRTSFRSSVKERI
jgi:hypothetical protein